MVKEALSFIIIGVILPQLCLGEPTVGPLLLDEDFNSINGSGFASRSLKHKNIHAARGSGPDNSDAIRVSYVGTKRGSQRVVFRHSLSKPVYKATLSYDVCFERDFKWTLGGKLHGLGPKRPVTGGKSRQPDGWSARIMFNSEGRCATYLYGQDKINKWGTGDKSKEPVFKAGKWHNVVLQVKLNNPNQSNGFVRILIDDKTVVFTENVNFRSSHDSSSAIRKLLFSTFHGGNNPKWTPKDQHGNPTTTYAYFDNFKVYEGIATIDSNNSKTQP